MDVPEGVDGMSLKNLVTGQKEPNVRESMTIIHIMLEYP